jgi:hypothetical protein
VTNSESFQSLKNWNQDLDINAPPGIIKVIIGNKNESENKIVTETDLKVRGDVNKTQFFRNLQIPSKRSILLSVRSRMILFKFLKHFPIF